MPLDPPVPPGGPLGSYPIMSLHFLITFSLLYPPLCLPPNVPMFMSLSSKPPFYALLPMTATVWCYEPSPASAWTLDATTCSILSLVPRTGLDCLTASKTSYSRIRNWNPVLCNQLIRKLTVDFKSFCLFPLASITDSYSKKESSYESSLNCCVTMKLVYKQVFSPF